MLSHTLASSLLIPFFAQNAIASVASSSWRPQYQGELRPYETGPVMPENFPDPCIIKEGGYWYSFGTNDGVANIQIARSPDFLNWELLYNANGTQADAMPKPPPWVDMSASNVWAPDVNEMDDGTFVMYFSASTLVSPAHHCVGAAVSKSVTGPYTPGTNPLFCPLDVGGAIDAGGFKDWSEKGGNWGGNDGWGWSRNQPHNSWNDNQWSQGGKGGTRWVTYKVDGNSIGHGGDCGNTVAPIVPTPIILQQVAADGITLIGPNYTILDNNGLPDVGIVEAPSLVKTAQGEYVLFFSTGCYSGTYTTSYATATSITGPYTRVYPPLLQTGDFGLNSPGGADVLWDAQHIVFHANQGAGFNGVRQLYVGIIDIDGRNVTI